MKKKLNNYESKQSQVKCDYCYDFRQIWGWSIYSIKSRLYQDMKHHKMLNWQECYLGSRKSNHNTTGINKETGQNAYESYCFEEKHKTQEISRTQTPEDK